MHAGRQPPTTYICLLQKAVSCYKSYLNLCQLLGTAQSRKISGRAVPRFQDGNGNIPLLLPEH